jgi:superfamily II DNA or RNA helicase
MQKIEIGGPLKADPGTFPLQSNLTNRMYLYAASCSAFLPSGTVKFGFTTDPPSRLSTYLTGCPPDMTPSQDLYFLAVWKTTAACEADLRHYEAVVQNNFRHFRLMRARPYDCEWFRFPCVDVLALLRGFLASRPWCLGEVPPADYLASRPSRPPSRFLKEHYALNLEYLPTLEKRIPVLEAIQAPVIAAIAAFVAGEETAGYVLAPCGSGKTKMATRGIRGLKKVIVCCPRAEIQNQWRATLLEERVFDAASILCVGGEGTTKREEIEAWLHKDTVCILTTYASSHLFVGIVPDDLDVLVCDEVHHMVGKVAGEETGEGRTRRLLAEVARRGLKRLSLTFTPRYLLDDGLTTDTYLTMDDAEIFGKSLAELKLRDLIKAGVLPDYRVWHLYDSTNRGEGLMAKAEFLLEAWNTTEGVEERSILHHLVVFTETLADVDRLWSFFCERTTDTVVLRVRGGDALRDPLAEFTGAKRSILINCKVLGEGVDIPAANAVAVLYPKQSRSEIVQMLLRAGRWYPGKPLFHILFPSMGDEDLSGFEEVLLSLASCDEQVRDEIALRTAPTRPSIAGPLAIDPETGLAPPECIEMVQAEGADVDKLRACFERVRLRTSSHPRRIQALCNEKGIDTSYDYEHLLRPLYPNLPVDPRPRDTAWYDYLHKERRITISEVDFVRDILRAKGLSSASDYQVWWNLQPTDVRGALPSLYHIDDGVFGAGKEGFGRLLGTGTGAGAGAGAGARRR